MCRPVLRVMHLLGRRWALRLLYEMHGGPLGLRELRVRCEGMSPSVLSTRLAELVEAGVLVRDVEGSRYALSDKGASSQPF